MATGDLVKLGTLFVAGTKRKRPLNPTYNGDILDYSAGQTVEIKDTDSDDAFKLQFREVSVGAKKLLLCDRNILRNITHDELKNLGFVTGKKVTIDGQEYLMRLLTGGPLNRDGGAGGASSTYAGGRLPNEWDDIIVNEGKYAGLPTPTAQDLSGQNASGAHNQFWNWHNIYSWCQETVTGQSTDRVSRGYYSARYWAWGGATGRYSNFGWRPVLEILNSAPTLSLDTQNNQVYYEGSTLNIAGKAKDTDVNDAVIVKYKIGSANERILTTQASQGKEFDYGKVLTFTKSRFYDGETPVSDVLLAGNTYQLQVWAQDDKGAKSTVETRNFTVVPNRKPLISVTDLPTLEGGTGITELSIKGTVNDPDGDDVTLTYKLNDGKETPLVVVEEAFEIDFTVEQLRVGVNNFTIIARDEYEALTTATVQVNVNKVSGGTEHIKKVAVFDLDMQGKETDGAVLWIRRPFTDDTDYTASISTVEPDAVESYSEMEKTTQIVQGNNRDQFTGKNETKGSKVSIKLDIEGEGNISMIQGVIK